MLPELLNFRIFSEKIYLRLFTKRESWCIYESPAGDHVTNDSAGRGGDYDFGAEWTCSGEPEWMATLVDAMIYTFHTKRQSPPFIKGTAGDSKNEH